MQFRCAELADIDNVLSLHFRYQVDSIAEEDKKDGFVTTPFTKEEMTQLITQERGLFIAEKEGEVVAYAMAASWQFWSKWPMFAHMIKGLPSLTYNEQVLSVDNSYQYGPVCVDKSVRGEGVFEQIFEFALQQMSTRYPILVTFINKINPRSYAAHVRKAKLDVIQEFEFNNNQYFELACPTVR
ncbi:MULTISPECIES: GNAT family N-acetyltransferase [Corallincola]|uniref:GNAT family acetyltransferase n=3 Tax=Corallincola TaxID=1775176 RepID=A0A368NRH9_9GAMM|nr:MULTISPECIES: GNAT family acetyltransferase [Corallincola]RCU52533.1 GNAT family acetyltransferase [Corallincola holothuriorum]TAA48271.1 GNAT family acetyltransferase [Corallincola spongiicola]TCI02420.1 GNAT family acetyltransferase [Corallincola luteus]